MYKDMKKIILLFACVCATLSMVAQSGESCGDPIPVDSNYVGSVASAGTVWYTAWTYDLPLHVVFTPNSNNSSVSPIVEVDFTCTRGVYDDPKLDSLINLVEDFGVDIPAKLTCDEVNRDGKVVWDLSINKSYREQMAAFGIVYNVQAFIKVTFAEGGTISMTPDTAFQACMDNAEYLHLDDTVLVLANDPDRSFVMPYTDWQNDSVRFVWIGDGEAKIYIADEECNFEPDSTNRYVWDVYTVDANQPYKLYSHQMKDAIDQCTGGGLLYGKIIATKPGKLVVEKIPMGQIEGGATLLEYGKSIQLPANNASALYCFPKTWTATQWLTTTSDSVVMFVSKTPDFVAVENDPSLVEGGVQVFEFRDGKSVLHSSSLEMQTFIEQASSDFLYVRFLAKRTTKLTPEQWVTSDCADNSRLIRPNTPIKLHKNKRDEVMRIYYKDFEGYPITIDWKKNRGDVTFYIGGTCDFDWSSKDPNVIFSGFVASRSSYVINEDKVALWASSVDDEGYLYFRAETPREGDVIFATEKPVQIPEPEPEPEPEPQPETLFPLVFDQSVNLEADNTTNTYYITRDWKNLNIELETNTADSVYAYFGTTADFELNSQDPNFLAVYPFFRENQQAHLQLSAKQLNGLLDATSDTLFVVFHAFYNTQLTTYKWNTCACVENSLELRPNDQHALIAYATNTVFRVNYSQWQDRDVTLLWNSNINLKAYLADTCDFKLTYSNKHVLNKKNYEIAANSSISIGKDVRTEAIDKGKLPDNGFLYFRFVSTEAGLLTTSFIQNGSGSTTDVDDVTLSPSYQLYIDADGRMYLYVDGQRYNILGQVVD